MTEEKKKEFTLRVSQCNRTELVSITDEIIIEYLREAKEREQQKQLDEMRFCLKKAGQFLDDLISALDMRFPVATELLNLYLYMKKCLLQADIHGCEDRLEPVVEMLKELQAAFLEVSKSDNGGNVMEQSEKVYAGLTYGKNSHLNEIVL